jgi:anaerobic carbon-monoxide dehydrogenase catalytic subunit
MAKWASAARTIDTIMARNFARMVAAGGAAHTDHGMSMLDLFREVVNGRIKDYSIKDVRSWKPWPAPSASKPKGKRSKEIATDLYRELERTYTQVEGEIPFAKRVPAKTLETWRKHGMVPRGAMREIMEIMHRTHMGVDQDYTNITRQCSRTALADGWGGSMVATEISDILFGTPSPVAIEVNMGVLKEDQVNIIIHGHEPNLFESMIESVHEPTLIEAAKAAGAKGINLVGMCCSRCRSARAPRHSACGQLHVHRGGSDHRRGGCHGRGRSVYQAGTGQSGRMLWDPLITTNPRCHIEGARSHGISTITIPSGAPTKSSSRPFPGSKTARPRLRSPAMSTSAYTAFPMSISTTCWAAVSADRTRPLNDNIINGRIRGVAGVVGCTNPRVKQDWVHVELVKELIKNDVLVLQTGCSQIALAKAGLTTPEAAHLAGPGLKEVCETVGMPPVLGLGSCVDNSRILIAASEMVRTGGLGDSIADLPVAGCAPEYMSEKAICIGQYFVASGVYTVFGVTFPHCRRHQISQASFRGTGSHGIRQVGLCGAPPRDRALMINHIDKKRKALGLDKTRERVLMDMSDRRSIDAA